MKQVSCTLRLPKPDYDRLRNLAAVQSRSKAQTISALLEKQEAYLLVRMTQAERTSYVAGMMSHGEAALIEKRDPLPRGSDWQDRVAAEMGPSSSWAA